MANRTLPFGYRMRSGNIVVVEDEAEIVRMIFASYEEGSSYEKLASGLNSRDIPFSPGRTWNKNAVARLLKDIRYLGDDTYPPIWRCSHCMAEAAHITDKRLMESTVRLLNTLCESPDMVKFTPASDAEDQYITGLRDSFSQELDRPDFCESTARSQAIALTAAQFDALGSEDYETMRIQRLLSQAEPKNGLDTSLLRQITSTILLRSNGAVSLKLKNGQIFERSDFT